MKRAFLFGVSAIVRHFSSCSTGTGRFAFLIVVYSCNHLLQLSRVASTRPAFYAGSFTGFGCALQASFFWNIFGAAAIAPVVDFLAFWLPSFVHAQSALPCPIRQILRDLAYSPALDRSRILPAANSTISRFSWINVGYVFASNLDWLPFHYLGMYGVGFVLVVMICLWELFRGSKVRFHRSRSRPRSSRFC